MAGITATISEPKFLQKARRINQVANTPRQLADVSGAITLSARYTPWGNTLELNGTGNFTFGYLGSILDASTGLLYVGNGQYYDPTTGRFLTRGVNPDSSNPYVPWNPLGALIGPLALFSLLASLQRWMWAVALAYWQLLLMRDTVKPDRPAWHPHKKNGQNRPLTPAQVQRSAQIFLLQSGTPAANTRPAGKGHGRQKGYRPAPRKRYEIVFKTKKAHNQPKTC